MLINNKNLIKTIKRVDLTTEQETNLKEITKIKKNINNIKTIIGDNENGLIKDVKNLKENIVSQDSVNMAVNNYLTEHPVQSGATVEQAAQIQANKTAIGDVNSGLTKDINDVKARINYNCTLKEYNNRDEMINDTTLKEGNICRTLGFYTPFDDGGAEYIITSENTRPTPGADGDLSNGLKFKYIIKDRRINIKACGIKEKDKTNLSKNNTIIKE